MVAKIVKAMNESMASSIRVFQALMVDDDGLVVSDRSKRNFYRWTEHEIRGAYNMAWRMIDCDNMDLVMDIRNDYIRALKSVRRHYNKVAR